jgi:hypothetical protein
LHGIHTCGNQCHQRLSSIIIHDLVEYVKTLCHLWHSVTLNRLTCVGLPTTAHDYPAMLSRICGKSHILKIVALTMLQNKLCQYGRTDT